MPSSLLPPNAGATDRRHEGTSIVVVLTVLSLVLVAWPRAGEAQGPPEARGIDGACPIAAQRLDRFLDIDDGAHAATVNCLAFYEVTRGQAVTDEGRIYAPTAPVTRGQLATFTTRVIELVTREELDSETAFPDDDVVHQDNIRKLATAGIVEGRGDGTFDPRSDVTRGQMATFVAEAVELMTGEELPSGPSFPDATGTHGASVAVLAAAGIVTGFDDGTYRPASAVTRAQMASFLARGMDVVADRGAFPEFVRPIEGAPSTEPRETARTTGQKAITDVRVGAHGRFDRVVFEVAGEGKVGWRIEYVPDARAPGSGDELEVAGEATLAVTLTGVTLPPELPDDITPWDVGRLDAPDDNVLTEVVDTTVVEGARTFYVGTSATAPFVVERLSDPQRVVIDVFRGFAPTEPPDIEEPEPEPEPDPDPAPEVVASFTTPFVEEGQPRNTNIRLAADYIDGDVIPAGGSYSLNEGIGPRTDARGFVGNGFIDEGGEVISVVGGGVSQMGTTFLNAAWFAGIQLDAFRQHTIYFDRYPMCREATLIWDVLDVAVTNDSPHEIRIDTHHTPTSVTVEFVSVPWVEVESWTGEPYDVTAGVGGPFSVDCGRTVTYPDGTTSTDTYSWRYDEGFPG